MDEVQNKLNKIEHAREEIEARVSKSLEELGSIEDTFNDVKTRQAKRMKADTRVDDSIIEQVQGDTE